MDKALLAEKHEFVRLFIDHSVVAFESYINEAKLLDLYNGDKKVS